MDFENLKGVLGDAYHEGITAEEVNTFFAGKNFADLSTGQYVDKNKYERDIQNLNNTITEQKKTIDSKLSDDEKKQAKDTEKDQLIAALQKQLKDNTIISNKDLAVGTMNNIKSLIDIKDDDSDFAGFIDNIVSDDRERTNAIATYCEKLVKEAYGKGSKDASKNALGDFGKSHKADGKSGKNDKNEESIGAKLGKLSAQRNANTTGVDYFKRG